jgi:hypothetical protein
LLAVLANSSGKSQSAITKNGTPGNPYRSPAYSNKGVITAVRGRRDLYFFNRRGGQLRKKRSISAGSLLAVVRGPNTTASATPTMVRVYAVSSLSTRPTERCDLRSAANSRIESPSWSPDGTLLAWGERGGIWVSPIAGGAGDCAAAPKRLIAGGSQPDWGPADVPKR